MTVGPPSPKDGRTGSGSHVTTAFWLAVALASMVLGILSIALPPKSESAETHARSASTAAPYWAYAVDPPAGPNDEAKPADPSARHVPGSTRAFTDTQIADIFFAPDWHPEDHPAMPGIVAHGRTPDVFACGYCHLPNGAGRPENSSLAGLPADYIVQQVADFKNGLRRSSNPSGCRWPS